MDFECSKRTGAKVPTYFPLGVRIIACPAFVFYEAFAFHETRIDQLKLPLSGGVPSYFTEATQFRVQH
jgi:hypothetical protein